MARWPNQFARLPPCWWQGTIAPAPNCTVTTHVAGSNPYDGKGLRFEVTLDAGCTCTSDRWWTLHWDFGSAAHPWDRLTYAAKVV